MQKAKRLKSGVPGLDDLIEGGLPEGTVTILSGTSGSGKTIFGLQFVCQGSVVKESEKGEKGIYISLEEGKESLFVTAVALELPLKNVNEKDLVKIIDMSEVRELCKDNRTEHDLVGFDTLKELLTNIFGTYQPKRFVLDSIGSIGLYYSTPQEFRREFFKFGKFLKKQKVTSLIITEAEDGNQTRFEVEPYIADAFILLGLENIKGDLRRTILVKKMRYTDHDISLRPFRIGKGGIYVESKARVYG